MDDKVLAAINGSIAKWQAIVDGTGTDDGVWNCPLCGMFYFQEVICVGCPVFEFTGSDSCKATPYLDSDVLMVKFLLDVKEWYGKGLEDLT